EETPREALRIARSEASTALKQSVSCAGQSMASSRRLVRSMPGMLAGLARGRLVPASAHGVGRTMAPASPAQRAQVDEILTAHLAHLEDCGPREWADEAEKVLHGLDPRGAAGRHRTAKKDRHVAVRRGQHGMCTLTANLPGLDGARIRKGLSIAAERARAQGDRRGHQQIMADLFVDALIGRGDGIGPSTLDVGVLITDRSLLAPDHADAALVEGYGPVPYEHVRAEMLEAMGPAREDPELAITLPRLYAAPGAGPLVAAESRARSFPPALARFPRLAHRTCPAPPPRPPRTLLPARARPLPPAGPPAGPRPSLRCGHPPAGPHRPLVGGWRHLPRQRQRAVRRAQPEGGRRPDRTRRPRRGRHPSHRRMDHPVRADGPAPGDQRRSARHRMEAARAGGRRTAARRTAARSAGAGRTGGGAGGHRASPGSGSTPESGSDPRWRAPRLLPSRPRAPGPSPASAARPRRASPARRATQGLRLPAPPHGDLRRPVARHRTRGRLSRPDRTRNPPMTARSAQPSSSDSSSQRSSRPSISLSTSRSCAVISARPM